MKQRIGAVVLLIICGVATAKDRHFDTLYIYKTPPSVTPDSFTVFDTGSKQLRAMSWQDIPFADTANYAWEALLADSSAVSGVADSAYSAYKATRLGDSSVVDSGKTSNGHIILLADSTWLRPRVGNMLWLGDHIFNSGPTFHQDWNGSTIIRSAIGYITYINTPGAWLECDSLKIGHVNDDFMLKASSLVNSKIVNSKIKERGDTTTIGFGNYSGLRLNGSTGSLAYLGNQKEVWSIEPSSFGIDYYAVDNVTPWIQRGHRFITRRDSLGNRSDTVVFEIEIDGDINVIKDANIAEDLIVSGTGSIGKSSIENWYTTTYGYLQLFGNSAFMGHATEASNSSFYMLNNCWFDTSGTWNRISNGPANRIDLYSGGIVLQCAPYGAANTPFSWTGGFWFDTLGVFSVDGSVIVGDIDNDAVQITGNGITFHDSSRINWDVIYPDSIIFAGGSSPSALSAVYTAGDCQVYSMEEESGVPAGIDAIAYYSGVDAIAWWEIVGGYNGQASHTVSLMLYNWTDTRYVSFESMGYRSASDTTCSAGSQVLFNYSFWLYDDDDYISSGNARLKVMHPSPGVPSHRAWFDALVIHK